MHLGNVGQETNKQSIKQLFYELLLGSCCSEEAKMLLLLISILPLPTTDYQPHLDVATHRWGGKTVEKKTIETKKRSSLLTNLHCYSENFSAIVMKGAKEL